MTNLGHGHVPVAPTDIVLMIITWGLCEVIDNALKIICASFGKYSSINGEIKVWGVDSTPALFTTRNSPPLLGLTLPVLRVLKNSHTAKKLMGV